LPSAASRSSPWTIGSRRVVRLVAEVEDEVVAGCVVADIADIGVGAVRLAGHRQQ